MVLRTLSHGRAARALCPEACCRRLVSRHFAVEVAPAVKVLGIPEAATWSSSSRGSPLLADDGDLETFKEVLARLQRRQQQGPLTEASEVQHLVQRSLCLADEASMEDLANLAECFVALRLRLPLRDLSMAVHSKLAPEVVPSLVRIVRCWGQGTLYFSDTFEFCNQHLNSMKASELALYIYEMGRHGLRCRHLMAPAALKAAELVPVMKLEEMLHVWQGLVRFSKDHRNFYLKARPRLQPQLSSMSIRQLLLVLRGARDLRHSMADLHGATCAALLPRVNELLPSEAAACLTFCIFSPRYRSQAMSLVKSITEIWTSQDLTSLRVVEAVDALECLASWNLRPVAVLERLDGILVDRLVELKYTGNISLWVVATQSLASLRYREASWPLLALELASDKVFLEKVPLHRQCELLAGFAQLGLFDAKAFRNFAELLLAEKSHFKDSKDMAKVLMSFAQSHFFHEEIFDTLYNLFLDMFQEESIKIDKRDSYEALVEAAWSFGLAGYHRKFESFASFLDHIFWKVQTKPASMRRWELAKLVLAEAPDVVKLSHCADEVMAIARSATPRSSDAAHDAFLAEVKSVLEETQWKHRIQPPEGGSLLDASMSDSHGEVGLLLVEKAKLLTTLKQEDLGEERWIGEVSMVRRLLHGQGWPNVVTLCEDEWQTAEEKSSFLRNLVYTET